MYIEIDILLYDLKRLPFVNSQSEKNSGFNFIKVTHAIFLLELKCAVGLQSQFSIGATERYQPFKSYRLWTKLWETTKKMFESTKLWNSIRSLWKCYDTHGLHNLNNFNDKRLKKT